MNSGGRTNVFELTPLGRATVVLAALALGAAWTTGSEPARLAACLLIAPLLADWAAKLRRFDGITVAVGQRRTRAGSMLVERVQVRNTGRRALWDAHLAESGLLASVRGQGVHVEHVPGGAERDVELPLRARTRGRATVRTFVLSTRHPLGLVRLAATLPAPAAVVAEPARIALPLRLPRHGRDGDDACASARGVDEEVFYALRELRDGEHFARVHALRSGTIGAPVRVLRRGARPQAARVLLDLRAPPGRLPQRSAGPGFEWGLSAAASLVDELTRRGQSCEIVVLGPARTTFTTDGDRGDALRLLDHLAGARPQAHAPAAEATLRWLAAGGGESFWIVAGGFAAGREREQAGAGLQVLEWAG